MKIGTKTTTIAHVRDETGRVIRRTEHTARTTDQVERYTCGPSGQYAVLSTANKLVSRTISLPGGAAETIAGLTITWSYSNLHGDVVLTAAKTGTRSATVFSYDPFGNPIGTVQGNIGTTSADDTVPDTQPGNSDYGTTCLGTAPTGWSVSTSNSTQIRRYPARLKTPTQWFTVGP